MSIKQICWLVALAWVGYVFVKAGHYYHQAGEVGDDYAGYTVFNEDVRQNFIVWWRMWDADIPIVSRAFYFIDYHFHAKMAVVFTINMATLCGIVFVWFLYLCRLGVAEFMPVILLLTFNWEQEHNFLQPFSGAAWFPSVLFPLIAFYCLATDRFRIALGSGVVSVGTMANGLLVLPLMAAMGWMTGLSRNKVEIILVVWLIICGFYAHIWFTYPAGGAGRLEPFEWDFDRYRSFALTYPGAPLIHVMEYWKFIDPAVASLMAGEIVLFLTAALLIGWHNDKTELAILCFLVSVIGTGFMIAIARHHYGTHYAGAPRYGATQLAGLQALGAMLFVRTRPPLRPFFLGLAVGVISVGFLPVQLYFEG